MPTAHEHFSEQFQKWEVRGRGWQVFADPTLPYKDWGLLAGREIIARLEVHDLTDERDKSLQF